MTMIGMTWMTTRPLPDDNDNAARMVSEDHDDNSNNTARAVSKDR